MRDKANRTDSSVHAVMLVNTTSGLSDVRCQDSLVSTDVKEIVAFLKGMCLTMGFMVIFAIKPESKEVAHVIRKGRICQRDVRKLLDMGFSEWTFSWAWAPEHFQFPDGEVVKVSESIDLSPVQTTVEAVRWGRALGRI